VLLGLATESDQRTGIEFIRRQLRPYLAPAKWQKQSHDHVLREAERAQGAFENAAGYLLQNSVRASLVEHWAEYRYMGCCVAGYPELDVVDGEYWNRFWRVYNYLLANHD
jgi:putative transposase